MLESPYVEAATMIATRSYSLLILQSGTFFADFTQLALLKRRLMLGKQSLATPGGTGTPWYHT